MVTTDSGVPAGGIRALAAQIVERTERVPIETGAQRGDGSGVARQLDIALMSEGFKLSGTLFARLAELHPVVVREVGLMILGAARRMIGGHVRHTSYFLRFPDGVPDTWDFWLECIDDALRDRRTAGTVAADLARGIVNLLALPRYGRYQHSYEEMLAAHDRLLPSFKGRMTVLQLGGSLVEEAQRLYRALAESSVPLSDEDRALLVTIVPLALDGEQPERIPVRETRALVNAARFRAGAPVAVETPTDILRLAAALSGGDVTLETPTRFVSFPRADRRRLLTALNGVLAADDGRRGGEITARPEPWKRLGERLHPADYQAQGLVYARDAFAVARGERQLRTLAGQVELELADGNLAGAVALLSHTPGMLVRQTDRLLRLCAGDEAALDALLGALEGALGRVSARMILSLVDHLLNRRQEHDVRIFRGRRGRAWVAREARGPLPETALSAILSLLNEEMERRAPALDHLVVGPAVCDVAIPLSEKGKPGGYGVLPRGSTTPIEGANLCFFVYWHQRAARTDYDLSTLILDERFQLLEWVSWTRLRAGGLQLTHSGDIVEAPAGATEFVDVRLDSLSQAARYVVPQVNVYAGEGFDEVEEAFVGYQERDWSQRGAPFEPRAVRAKSDLAGSGRVALPFIAARARGGWEVRWSQIVLSGSPRFNAVETNRLSTALLVKGVAEHDALRVGYLIEMLSRKAGRVSTWQDDGPPPDGPVTYVGLSVPEGLPYGSHPYTLHDLSALIGIFEEAAPMVEYAAGLGHGRTSF